MINIIPMNRYSPLLQSFASFGEDFKEEVGFIEWALSDLNPFWKHGFGQGFIAIQNGVICGRLFVSFDESLKEHAERSGGDLQAAEKIYHIGFPRWRDDNVAEKLLQAAQNWSYEKGATLLHGPLNLNILLGYRTRKSEQIGRFFSEPDLREDVYGSAFVKNGFSSKAKWHSWFISLENAQKMGQDAISRYRPDENLKLCIADKEHFGSEWKRVLALAYDVFEENYGFARISFDEFMGYLEPLAAKVQEGLLASVEEVSSGKKVGFQFGFRQIDPQDPNREIFIMHTLGIHKDFRRRGVLLLLRHAMAQYMQKWQVHSIAAMTKGGQSPFEAFMEPLCTYTLFEKRLQKDEKRG